MANPTCPVPAPRTCRGVVCGHCKTCRCPIDMHNGLGMGGKPATCPDL